jgi:hypothetical protein
VGKDIRMWHSTCSRHSVHDAALTVIDDVLPIREVNVLPLVEVDIVACVTGSPVPLQVPAVSKGGA